MSKGGLLSKMRSMRIIVVFLALLLAYGAVTYSPQAATPTTLYSVSLGGVTGAANNTILAYGRYVMIAPFWPSTGLAENGDLDVSQLDNDSLYVIDTKKPNAPPLSRKLTSADRQNTVYFPSKILFDPASSNVYVRGTRFEVSEGEVTAIDVIAYVHFNLDETGKPVVDSNVVTFDIPGVSTEHTSEAPLDFALSGSGNTLVFTNGASVFSFNIAEGYLKRVDIVEGDKYGADDSISFLSVDAATNVVSVCENRTYRRDLGNIVTKTSSEISFFRLGEHGTFDLLKQTSLDQFPDGIGLINGSNIAIGSDSDSQSAFFVTNDGSLCMVDLLSEGSSATVKRVYTFPDLAQFSLTHPNPLFIQYDTANRVIGIVRPGFTVQIARPSGGRRGRIARPSGIQITSEAPVLAMARLSKKNKVTSNGSFTEEFAGEGGLSNLVSGEDSQWLIATYSGKLYSVGMADNLQNSTLQLMGPVGSNVERIDYYADRTNVVAISSFTFDEDGIRMASPGSLVVGKTSALQSLSNGAILQAFLPTASTLGRPAPSIARPGNIKR